MASESTVRRDGSPVRIRVIGGGDVADAARSALASPDGVSVRATDVDSLLARSEPSNDNCALVAAGDVDLSSTIERVREAVSPVPVAALVANDDRASLRAAIEAGAVDALVPDESLADRVSWIARAGEPASLPPIGRAADEESSARADPIGGAAAFAALASFEDAICRLDSRWRVIELTDSAADLFGAPTEDLRGTSLWTAHPDLAGTDVRAACWRAALSGERATAQTWLGDRRLAATVVPAADGLILRLRDETERADERQALDRYERILETIDDGIYTLDENFRITGVNEAVTELTGYSRDELVGAHSTLLADESVIVEASDVIQKILSGERDSGRLEVSLETAAGERFPAETHFSALRSGNDSYGSVGVIRDITDRKRYERTLTGLNRSTDELFRAETKREVADLVVGTATDVLDLGAVALYFFDEDEGRLSPIAWSDDEAPPAIRPDAGDLWRSYVEGTPTDVESPFGNGADGESADAGVTGDGGSAVAEGLSTPLGDHGLLVTVPSAGGPPEDDLETLTELLAANAVAALDRVDRASELASRERTLASRNEELTRLNRFNELIRDVNRALVETDSRAAIERAVCERLADSPLLEFAWIGEYDAAHDHLLPRAWAGAERGYLDSLSASAGGDSSPGDVRPVSGDAPSRTAARDGESAVVDNVAEGLQGSDWRQRALSCEFLSVASVPLVYNDYSYGVLSVYATDPAAFDDATRTMFEELGVTTANAINGAQAKETLFTESVVELDVRVPASNAPLRRLAEAAGGEIRLAGQVPQSEGKSLLYLSVGGADPVSALGSVAPVERVTEVSERDGAALVEVLVAGPTVPTRLADYGAAIDDLVADPESITVSVELPPGVDVRELIETLAATYPGTELLSRRTRERSFETSRSFRTNLEGELTDRQLDALRTAFLSGYFEWPRERAGQDVAASLDISQPTFARHLRIAQRKLLTRLFDDG